MDLNFYEGVRKGSFVCKLCGRQSAKYNYVFHCSLLPLLQHLRGILALGQSNRREPIPFYRIKKYISQQKLLNVKVSSLRSYAAYVMWFVE